MLHPAKGSACFFCTDPAAEQLECLFKNICQSIVFKLKLVKGHEKSSMLKRLEKKKKSSTI